MLSELEQKKKHVLEIMRPPNSALVTELQAFINEFIKPGMVVAEIGVFAGAASRMFAAALGRDGYFLCIDKWEFESCRYCTREEVKIAEQLFDEFYSQPSTTSPVIVKLKMSSYVASQAIDNDYLDLVYIDADHDYFPVLDDIKSWVPKVKPGGIISGHDFHESWPGVVKAVRESFSSFKVFGDGTWVARKEDYLGDKL